MLLCLSHILSFHRAFSPYRQGAVRGIVAVSSAQDALAALVRSSTFFVFCRGTLPPWPASAKLELLDLTANSITGSLPPAYADLRQLKMLLLSANQLHGCAQK